MESRVFRLDLLNPEYQKPDQRRRFVSRSQAADTFGGKETEAVFGRNRNGLTLFPVHSDRFPVCCNFKIVILFFLWILLIMKLYSNGLDVDPMVIVEVPLVESIFQLVL